MSGSVVNNLLLTRYEKLLNELCIKPENEEIVVTFLSVANEEEKIEATKKQQEKKEVRSRDIWDMLPNPRSKKDGTKKIIALDQLIYAEDQLSPCLNRISLSVSSKGGKIAKFQLFEIFSRVIIFAIAALKNISRVFDFANSTKLVLLSYLRVCMHLGKKINIKK